jgi:hypothetical protein
MRNRLDSLSRSAQRTFKELSSSLNPEERQDAIRVFSECTEALQSTDEVQVQRALTDIERVAALLTNAMLGGVTPAVGSIVTNSNDPG